MLDYNNQYETHALYNHFKNWIDMSIDYTDSYFIINTALYAAEDYIYNTYSVSTRAIQVHEYFGDVTEDIIYPRFALNNLLAAYATDGYVLPSVMYYDSTEGTYVSSEGDFRIDAGNLIEVSATNLNLDYITGYTLPMDAKDTSVVPTGNDDWGDSVTRPALSNPDGSPLYSPLSTSNTYYDLYVIGDPGSIIYVNGVEAVLLDAGGTLITEDVNPQPIINENRIGKLTLTLSDGINAFDIHALDESANESQVIPIVINKQTKFMDTRVELISKDLVTNDGNYKLTIKSIPGSTITINGADELTYSTGLDIIEVTVSVEEINFLSIITTSPAGTVSRALVVHILYDSSLSNEYVNAVNETSFNDIEMPQDVLMALLMIAHHYFRIALYKHDETASYGDNVSNRTTFNSDRFPKEAHKILSRYVKY